MKPFLVEKPLIGMIHLRPLAGSVGYRKQGTGPILDLALRNLYALETGGIDAVIVENLGDAPYAKMAPRETIAMMAVIVQRLVEKTTLPVGVNVLRNDGLAAMAIAAATGASFIRVNVFTGVAIDAARNNPDGLIVSGIGTGKRTPPEDLQVVKGAVNLPVFVGSGVRIDNLSTYRDADGFIVGTVLKENGKIDAPIDVDRVRALAEGVATLRKKV